MEYYTIPMPPPFDGHQIMAIPKKLPERGNVMDMISGDIVPVIFKPFIEGRKTNLIKVENGDILYLYTVTEDKTAKKENDGFKEALKEKLMEIFRVGNEELDICDINDFIKTLYDLANEKFIKDKNGDITIDPEDWREIVDRWNNFFKWTIYSDETRIWNVSVLLNYFQDIDKFWHGVDLYAFLMDVAFDKRVTEHITNVEKLVGYAKKWIGEHLDTIDSMSRNGFDPNELSDVFKKSVENIIQNDND